MRSDVYVCSPPRACTRQHVYWHTASPGFVQRTRGATHPAERAPGSTGEVGRNVASLTTPLHPEEDRGLPASTGPRPRDGLKDL